MASPHWIYCYLYLRAAAEMEICMREREVFLDKLRVSATCAVVLLHTVTGVMDTTDMSIFPVEYKVFLTVMDLICWCVPVFVLISGYLFLNPAREISWRQMLTKYCRRILQALFLFGVPYALLEQIATERTFRMGMLGNSFLMVLQGKSWSHMWYLYMILVLYLLTPVMKRLLERTPRPALYVLLGVLAAGGSILPYLGKLFEWELQTVLPDGTIYLFYYLCGYLFSSRRGRSVPAGVEVRSAPAGVEGRNPEGAAERRMRAMGRILCAAAAVTALGMAVSRLSGNYTVQMAYNYPFTVMLALFLFGWGFVRSRAGAGRTAQKNTGFWSNTAALTFAVYLIHPVFLNVFYKFLHITPLDFNIGVSLPLFFAATLALSFGAAWVLYQIPVLRKHVL